MEYARAEEFAVTSERLARLQATMPPPGPIREARAEQAAKRGAPVVRLWTDEVPPPPRG